MTDQLNEQQPKKTDFDLYAHVSETEGIVNISVEASSDAGLNVNLKVTLPKDYKKSDMLDTIMRIAESVQEEKAYQAAVIKMNEGFNEPSEMAVDESKYSNSFVGQPADTVEATTSAGKPQDEAAAEKPADEITENQNGTTELVEGKTIETAPDTSAAE